MIDYILDLMESQGVYVENNAEYEQVLTGIRLYLHENGIAENEERTYYKKYVRKHMDIISREDLKTYFILYPCISRINQIVIEHQHGKEPDTARKTELYQLMGQLFERHLDARYIPADEVRAIIGKV